MNLDKRDLSEQDICNKFVTPALTKEAGWDMMRQIRTEYTITPGKILPGGKKTRRGQRGAADYVLFYKPNIPIAIIEVKKNKFSVGEGLQQALEYGRLMDVPFVYSTNGDAFKEHDRTKDDESVEREFPMHQFPTPQELWQRYLKAKGLTPQQEKIILQNYYIHDEKKTPRYYQLTAINRTVEAIAKGQNRILLVMATGTGKTFTAFQIIWRLWKAGVKKRILFLVDRTAILNQTMTNDFSPFEGKIHRIQNRTVDKSFEVFMALYQSITGNEEEKNIYTDFTPGFFDLIVVDECHRGSAAEDSQWRLILDYFSEAAQIGMTATPKETEYVSNIDYFGEPIYTYSLNQGIEDGFLAPYKVIQLVTDKDTWRPNRNQLDKFGNPIPDKQYQLRDHEKSLVLEPRCDAVAKRVTEFLKGTDRFSTTIIFCQDIDHAERMRSAMVKYNADIAGHGRDYVARITSGLQTAHADLDAFIDPYQGKPIVAVTSKLMTTGVDSQECKLIVIDQDIRSLSLFKQIIGRGTRINEELGKTFFVIMDFRGATAHFADPQFDGQPMQVYEPKADEPVLPPDVGVPGNIDTQDGPSTEYDLSDTCGDVHDGDFNDPGTPGRIKYYVNNEPVRIIHETVYYIDGQGKKHTKNIRQFCRDAVREKYRTLDHFLNEWTEAQRKAKIIEELEEHGLLLEDLQEAVGKELDVFDLIRHIAFDAEPLPRRQRAKRVSKSYLEQFSGKARAVMDALLDKYSDQGFFDVTKLDVLTLHPFNHLGSKLELVRAFGGKEKYLQAVRELENQLYAAA